MAHAAAWAGAAVAFVVLATVALLFFRPTYERLERAQTEDLSRRAMLALGHAAGDLERLATDWSAWDDAYRHLRGEYPEFVERNFGPEIFANAQLEGVVLFDAQAAYVSGYWMARDGRSLVALPEGLREALAPAATRPSDSASLRGRRGLLEIGGELYLVAARPVLPSNAEPPAVGTLMMVRPVGGAVLGPISEVLGAQLSLTPLAELPAGEVAALTTQGVRQPVAVALDAERVAGRTLLVDLFNRPVAELRVVAPREIVARGDAALADFAIATGALLAVVALASGFLLARLRGARHLRELLEQRYRSLVGQALEGIALIEPASGRLLLGNPALSRLLGLRAGESGTISLAQIAPELASSAAREQALAASESGARATRLRHQEGHFVEVEASLRRVRSEEGEFLLLLVRDISERLRAERALRESEMRLRQVSESIQDVVLNVDAIGVVRFATPSATAALGHSVDQLLGQPLVDLVAPADRSLVRGAIESLLRDGTPARFEVRFLGRAEELVWLETIATAIHGEGGGVVGAVLGAREVGARREYETQIRFAAMHDALTALPNRRSLHGGLEDGLEEAARRSLPLAVLYLDLDRFKSVNDSLGHDAGDELLVEVAMRLRSCVREGDLLARMGGDEFACVLLGADEEPACNVARRMVESILQPFRLRGQVVELGASVGVSLFPAHGATLVDLIRVADIAMYQAKARGSGVAVYDRTKASFSPERLALESKLREATREGRLELALQPILDLRSGEIAEAEALVRLRRGEDLFSASEFIPVAEESALIEEIDREVLRIGLGRLRRQLDAGRLRRLSVNLSARTLRSPEVVADLGRLLTETGVPPAALILEVTETSVLMLPDVSRRVLAELHASGVRIALDDFGTGFSSLINLRELPVDRLKIDRVLVAEIGHSETDARLLRATIALGKSLGLEVVAEGVETPEQLDWLRREGCDFAQGWTVGRPAEAAPEPPDPVDSLTTA